MFIIRTRLGVEDYQIGGPICGTYARAIMDYMSSEIFVVLVVNVINVLKSRNYSRNYDVSSYLFIFIFIFFFFFSQILLNYFFYFFKLSIAIPFDE